MSHRAASPRRIPFAVCIAVLSVIALAGCTFSSSSTPSSAASGTVSPSPPPTPSAGSSALDGGDCATFLPTASVQAALGVDLPLDAHFSGPDYSPAAVGGIGCSWQLGQQAGDGGALSLTVVPAVVGTAAEISALTDGSPNCGTRCEISFVLNGWWVDATVGSVPAGSDQRPVAVRTEAAIRAAIGTRIPPKSRGKGATTCMELDAAVDPTASLGQGLFVPQTISPPMGSADAAADRSSGRVRCFWQVAGSSATFDLTVFPGARAPFDICAAQGSEPASVPGVKRVVVFAPVEGVVPLCATDGISTVMTVGPIGSGTFTQPWTAEQLALEAKVLVPALAFASR